MSSKRYNPENKEVPTWSHRQTDTHNYIT